MLHWASRIGLNIHFKAWTDYFRWTRGQADRLSESQEGSSRPVVFEKCQKFIRNLHFIVLQVFKNIHVEFSAVFRDQRQGWVRGRDGIKQGLRAPNGSYLDLNLTSCTELPYQFSILQGSQISYFDQFKSNYF